MSHERNVAKGAGSYLAPQRLLTSNEQSTVYENIQSMFEVGGRQIFHIVGSFVND